MGSTNLILVEPIFSKHPETCQGQYGSQIFQHCLLNRLVPAIETVYPGHRNTAQHPPPSLKAGLHDLNPDRKTRPGLPLSESLAFRGKSDLSYFFGYVFIWVYPLQKEKGGRVTFRSRISIGHVLAAAIFLPGAVSAFPQDTRDNRRWESQ